MNTPQQPTEEQVAKAIAQIKRGVECCLEASTPFGIFDTDHIDTVLAALAASRRDLEQAQRWICTCSVSYGGDHACAQCYPHSEMLIKDFVCARHKAIDAAAKGVAE